MNFVLILLDLVHFSQLGSVSPDFKNIIRVPITKLAIERLGKSLFANIVALRIIVKVTRLVDFETIKNWWQIAFRRIQSNKI